jgi:uncharacterized membrane protein
MRDSNVLDLITPAVDVLSVAVLVFLVYLALMAVRGFRQSKQAVTESASLVSVIVNALTSRVEASESLVTDLRSDFDTIVQHRAQLEDQQSGLRASYLQVLQYLQEILSNDKRLIVELEQLKTRFTSIQQRNVSIEPAPRHAGGAGLHTPDENVLAALTPTERHTLEILSNEGPKAAPDLGRRMRKSREHMARLMKKLYLEGYVDRESNHAPFRYKLNEKIGSLLKPTDSVVSAEPSEKA